VKLLTSARAKGLMLLACLAFLLTALAVPGAPPKKKAKEEEIPLHITAARLDADQEKRLIIFRGQVKAVYGDSIMYADELYVYYKPTQEKKPGAETPARKEPADTSPLSDLGGEKLDRIVAKGKVKFVQEDKVATCQEAIFYQDKDEVVLLGNPQVWRGENSLKGEKITLYLKTKQVLVESSPKQRVEAHLYQGPGKKPLTKEIIPGTKDRKKKKP